jgi:hypothetical protein
MCCDNEVKVSEDVRVIHNELEKAYTWIFAAQEILRPENEEFDPDLKDIGNIEVAITFAINDLKEAISLCQIYKASREDVNIGKSKVQAIQETDPLELNEQSVEQFRAKVQKLVDPQSPTFRALKIQEAKTALTDLEKKIDRLKALNPEI